MQRKILQEAVSGVPHSMLHPRMRASIGLTCRTHGAPPTHLAAVSNLLLEHANSPPARNNTGAHEILLGQCEHAVMCCCDSVKTVVCYKCDSVMSVNGTPVKQAW